MLLELAVYRQYEELLLGLGLLLPALVLVALCVLALRQHQKLVVSRVELQPRVLGFVQVLY